MLKTLALSIASILICTSSAFANNINVSGVLRKKLVPEIVDTTPNSDADTIQTTIRFRELENILWLTIGWNKKVYLIDTEGQDFPYPADCENIELVPTDKKLEDSDENIYTIKNPKNCTSWLSQ